jgi:hypothetical protein
MVILYGSHQESLIFSIIFNQIKLLKPAMMLSSNLAQAVTSLTCIRVQIPVRDINYFDSFCNSSQSLQEIPEYYVTASFHIVFYSLFNITQSFDAIETQLLSASLNNPRINIPMLLTQLQLNNVEHSECW